MTRQHPDPANHGNEPSASHPPTSTQPAHHLSCPRCDASEGTRCKDHTEYDPPDDIAYNMRTTRVKFVNWQYGWGSETQWESEFNTQLAIAREEGQGHVDKFFCACEEHVVSGWEILKDLKFVASVSCNSTHDEIRDLFLQGYEMVIATALEVKFFDMKLQQYAPAISTAKISDIRMYSG